MYIFVDHVWVGADYRQIPDELTVRVSSLAGFGAANRSANGHLRINNCEGAFESLYMYHVLRVLDV